MLSEMNRDGLRWLFGKLFDSQIVGFPVVAESLGSSHVYSMESTLRIIAELGFDGKKTANRYWVFGKTSTESNMRFETPHLSFSQKAVVKFRSYLSHFHDKSSSDSIHVDASVNESSVISRILAEFPDIDGPDYRFRSRRW